MKITTRTQPATVEEQDGAYYVLLYGQRFAKKPERNRATADDVVRWLNGLSAFERRPFVEMMR